MSYVSIDQLQGALSTTVFKHAKDAKKAAGRALGTVVEIIAYYLSREWGLKDHILIERPLPEYGNDMISHNVEFSFHPVKQVHSFTMTDERPLTSTKLLRYVKPVIPDGVFKKPNTLITTDGLLRNACVIGEDDQFIYMMNIDDKNKGMMNLAHLYKAPFAMVECKRVGIEDGCKKGPQTIEKAKQGAYVARTTSSLQKVRDKDGSVYGVIYDNDKPIIKPYSALLDEIVSHRNDLLKDFILSVGVVSNHGNWFSQEDQNKELKVLAQSYDWLLFLSDGGLAQFISDLLLNPNRRFSVVRDAFISSYQEGKKKNVFTKTKIDYKAHQVLAEYFRNNIKNIEGWFNVITPQGSDIDALKQMLYSLKSKNWEEIL